MVVKSKFLAIFTHRSSHCTWVTLQPVLFKMGMVIAIAEISLCIILLIVVAVVEVVVAAAAAAAAVVIVVAAM